MSAGSPAPRSEHGTALERRLAEGLAGAVRWVIADRDMLYASVSTASGSIPDPDDRQELEALDAAIDGWAELLEEAGLEEWRATRRALREGLPGGNT